MTPFRDHADRKTPRCSFPVCCQKKVDPYLAKINLSKPSKDSFFHTELTKGRKYNHTVHTASCGESAGGAIDRGYFGFPGDSLTNPRSPARSTSLAARRAEQQELWSPQDITATWVRLFLALAGADKQQLLLRAPDTHFLGNCDKLNVTFLVLLHLA